MLRIWEMLYMWTTDIQMDGIGLTYSEEVQSEEGMYGNKYEYYGLKTRVVRPFRRKYTA